MLGIGLASGLLGGLGGLGGSIIMIPAMTFFFHHRAWDDQHLYQAAAMVMNIAVAIPATLRHRKHQAIRADMFKLMLGPTIIFVVLGVLVSNFFPADVLEKLFALFLLYVCIQTAWQIVRRQPDHTHEHTQVTPLRAGAVGSVMGFAAGLLGVGGGVIAVPLGQRLCRLPLRQAIAVSSAVMVFTSSVGAIIKVGTLPQHHHEPAEALVIALILSPTVVLGGYLGAGLTHRLHLNLVRAILVVMLLASAAKMGGVW